MNLELQPGVASPEEAAAIVGAIERFVRDTAPPAIQRSPTISPWLRAARLEACAREPTRVPW
jgi:hypothetical protein